MDSFKEKPDYETAVKYVKSKEFFWNSGIFIWNVNTIVNSLRIYEPEISDIFEDLMPVFGTAKEQKMINEQFPKCPSISIDYAVMEPAAKDGKVFTHPADFGWSDLGNWSSLHDKLTKDENNNGAVGNVNFYECSNCVVHAEDAKKVVLQGLDGYIVSEKNGRFLVCKRSEEQRIKEFSAE